jgi:bifunctional non-homologous end joining protein LigD
MARGAARRKLPPKRSRSHAVDRSLTEYRKRRRFDRTPEPAGGRAARAPRPGLAFVVQKHAARRLHYDFRLELDGVLPSWSVPKGPSLSPTERRLAVRTEDHPLEYAGFEGVIPQGEYGAGTVIIWDRGTWEPEGDPQEGLRKGRLTFTLHGEKLRGRWHLVRTKLDGGKRENWLLFKGRDAEASDEADVVSEQPRSAASGRTLEEVGEARDRVWHSDRPKAREGAKAAAKRGSGRRAPGRTADLADLVRALPVGFPLTNLDKVLYPELGLRKAELIAYYASMADRMLPHLADRPLTLVRCPEGRHNPCFFQKHAVKGVPEVVRRIEIAEDRGAGTYMLVDDLAGLVALAQLGTLEVHTWACHADKVERPDQLIFDIDPDVGLAWDRVVEAALDVRGRLSELGLQSFVKTTGGKGLHVVAPVRRRLDWEAHKEFAHALVERMAADHPDRYTTNARKTQREGRLFLDYLRNARGATAVAPYSPRAREGATVAMPLTWQELERGIDPRDFTVFTAGKWLDERGRDPWAGYGDLRQAISARAVRKLSGARRRLG